jgi:hypothetical protein
MFAPKVHSKGTKLEYAQGGFKNSFKIHSLKMLFKNTSKETNSWPKCNAVLMRAKTNLKRIPN